MTKNTSTQSFKRLASGITLYEVMMFYIRNVQWTSFMGALLVNGLQPVSESEFSTQKYFLTLSGESIHISSPQVHDARTVLRRWRDCWDDEDCDEDEPSDMHAADFINWCDDVGIENAWLSRYRELFGCKPEYTTLDFIPPELIEAISKPIFSIEVPQQSEVKSKPSVHRHTLKNRTDALDAIIRAARKVAMDPNDYQSVWLEILEMAQVPSSRVKPLTGVSENQSTVYWIKDGKKQAFTKNSLKKRIATLMANHGKS